MPKGNSKLVIFVILFSLFFVLIVSAQETQEEAKYNFGSMQAAKQLSIKPGQFAETKLYFYNLYGNRATHIKLSIEEKPENWEVDIKPELKNVDYEVAGLLTEVEENLIVYPSEAQQEAGTNTATIEFISSKVGYIGANFVIIRIKVPENEKIGKTEKIKINAIAFWLGQGGTTALQQERDFEYSVKTVTDYYEKPVEEEKQMEEKEEKGISRITGAVTGTNLSAGILLVTSFILVIVILFLLVRIKRIRNEKFKGK